MLKGESPEQAVRTIICRQVIPGPKKDRWHPLYTSLRDAGLAVQYAHDHGILHLISNHPIYSSKLMVSYGLLTSVQHDPVTVQEQKNCQELSAISVPNNCRAKANWMRVVVFTRSVLHYMNC